MSEGEIRMEQQPIDQNGIITGTTYRLNDVGAKVWELLETGSTVADITTAIRQEYRLPDDVTPQQVTDDVTKIITDLHQYGLVVFGAAD
jgi:hypothetical protein